MSKLKLLNYITVAILLMVVQQIKSQDKVFIPDPNFRDFINAAYPDCMDVSGDSLFTDSAAMQTGVFDCYHQEISNLTGVEHFTNISELKCHYNNLTTLPDLSDLTALTNLSCQGNQLESLPDLSSNILLTILYCTNNNLSSLPDLSANTLLTTVKCSNNQLAVLPDLSSNTELAQLFCNNNLFKSLPDLSANTALTALYCSNNQLSRLPYLSNLSSLKYVDLRNNKLDFSDAKALQILDTLDSLGGFYYEPQNPFGEPSDTILNIGDPIIFSIASQDSATGYQWFRNGIAIENAFDTSLIISNISAIDMGIYTCKSYGTSLQSPPMNHGPGIVEFISMPKTLCIETLSTIYDTACYSYTSPSGLYTWELSGTYTDTLQNSSGCDSILTIELTVRGGDNPLPCIDSTALPNNITTFLS